MPILITGFFTLSFAFFMHVLIWRVRKPKRAAASLLAIFFLSLPLALALQPWVREPVEYLYVAVFHIAMTLAYLLAFPGIESESPSSLIVLALEAAGPHGLTREQLAAIITDELFVNSRLEGLLQGRHVTEKDGRFYITDSGHKYLNFFLFYRKIMGHLPEGG